MNTKIAVAILAVACLGFAVAMVVLKHQAEAQQVTNASTTSDFSNQIVKANVTIEDLNQANLNLRSDLATNREMSLALSNQLVETAGTLTSTASSLQSAQQQITNLNEHVADLEAQNLVLDQRASSLSNTIASLDTQITFTQMKLAASQTNNEFLNNELKQQVAQRAELEHKFNDLAEVRAQVRKLRDDLFIARRLEWMREGVDPTKMLKGGQLLMQRAPVSNAAPAAASPSYNLNVEVGSDGSVHVAPPPTNSPPK
jgi:DNA repair exonuclease SbcCD ATPase subunit